MRDRYKTLTDAGLAADYELIEKKSRFIASGGNARSEEEVLAILAAARVKYPGASHHVYACRIESLEKCSDDGEPSGTAGLPVLGLLQKAGLQYCALVVTRYFGGILLGAGGLARAYGACARGFADANAVHKARRLVFDVAAGYHAANVLQRAIQKECIVCENVDYREKVTFRLLTAPETEGALKRGGPVQTDVIIDYLLRDVDVTLRRRFLFNY